MDCWFWKKEHKSVNKNNKSSNTNEGGTIVVASKSDVLFTVSVEEAYLYTSSSSIDWVLDSGASHHVTPRKNIFFFYI